MDIRFVSSLTADDEDQFAPALLKAIGCLLDQFPIAYTVRIETLGGREYQHTHPTFTAAASVAVPLAAPRSRQRLVSQFGPAAKKLAP
jgi:hypothetical protein